MEEVLVSDSEDSPVRLGLENPKTMSSLELAKVAEPVEALEGAATQENSGSGDALGGRRRLRKGFSTGAAAAGAARAALRRLLIGESSGIVAVRLAAGYFLPVPVHEVRVEADGSVVAVVVKDGGDDPDVTNKAHLGVRVRLVGASVAASPGDFASGEPYALSHLPFRGVCLVGGEGVGVATKPGLPVRVGEPAINPGPREMILRNAADELLRPAPVPCASRSAYFPVQDGLWSAPDRSHVFLPFPVEDKRLSRVALEIEVRVEDGEALARRTLNPRLGILGGLSILGTTGIVKPFSHKAYEETIDVALSVARSSGCDAVVLSTGGKSEHYARPLCPDLRTEAFVQIADFFAYAVTKAHSMGFRKITHSAFFGKVVKMAQGHAYTHAHEVPLDLVPLARLAGELGRDDAFCAEIAGCNTARHALELLLAAGAADVIHAVSQQALCESARIAGPDVKVRLLLFDFDGAPLADVGPAGEGGDYRNAWAMK